MNINKYYLELINKINQIQNNPFVIKTLREISLININIIYYYKKNKLSSHHFTILNNQIKKITEKKLLQVNPKLNKKVLDIIFKSLYRGYNSVPSDISIINNDIVLLKEEKYDNPYTNKILILNNKYKEIAGQKASFVDIKKINQSNFEEYFNFFCSGLETKSRKAFNYIISIINEALKPLSNIEQTIQYNNTLIENKSHIKVFIDTSIEEIIKSIFNKKNKRIKLIAIGDWNEFYMFEITQTVLSDKSFTWSITPLDINVWNLSESLEKKDVLTKKKAKKW